MHRERESKTFKGVRTTLIYCKEIYLYLPLKFMNMELHN